MNRLLHSITNCSTLFNQSVARTWTPVKSLEDKFIYDSYFVAALVFFIAAVERIVNITHSLSQFNPVTASNSHQFDGDLITDAFPKTVFDNALGVTPYDPTTVAFLNKRNNDFFKRLERMKQKGLSSLTQQV